jgi:hypothetical protein
VASGFSRTLYDGRKLRAQYVASGFSRTFAIRGVKLSATCQISR